MISTNFPIKNQDKLKEWQIVIIRKTDFLNIVGTLNVLLGLILFNSIGFHGLNTHFYIVFGLAFLTFLSNRTGKILISTYLFFAIGVYLLSVIVILVGIDTYALMYYFPITMSIVQLFGRKETFYHMVVWLFIYFFNIVLLLLFADNFVPIAMSETTHQIMSNFNILFAFFCGLILIAIITRNTINMETTMRKTAEEKELLLAELFHRVKNNLNLVTSLLNIRKNKSNSPEVIDALEDCRNRVFSIALVHQKMYSGKQIGNLNLNDFIKELIYNIEHIFGNDANVKIKMDDEIQLPVSKAVPTGLILNEVLTNVYKHAQIEGKRLEILVSVSKRAEILEFIVEDNGPGLGVPDQQLEHLGLELIHSLSEQLEGKFNLQSTEIGTKATFTFAHH